MFYATLLLAATAFSGLVASQNFSACCSLDPNSVPIATRQEWCRAEQNTCPELCGGIGNLAQNGNECDTGTLNFTCACADGTKPNMSDYQQSLPAQECLMWQTECVAASPNDLQGQTACLSIQCGNKTVNAASASSSSSAAPSSTGGAASSGASGASQTVASATSSTAKGAATALALAREYGTPVLAAGMMAVFGIGL